MYQRKYNLDGTLNPQWKPDERRRAGDRHKPGSRYVRQSGFVGWDGEGVKVNGVQQYVLLLSSEGDRAFDPNGLSTDHALETIYRSAERHRANYHVGFAFGYDVNMILRDVPRRKIGDLWAGEQITFNGWRMYYRNRKEFALKRTGAKFWAHIWDVFGFFQSSFVEALQSYKIASGDMIADMKARRSEFTLDDMAEVEPYCKQEVLLLREMMDVFHSYVETAELNLTRYDGAGAIAAALFRKHKVRQHKAESPDNIRRAARHSYFGGRIELARYGAVQAPIYEYDLRSAYPSSIIDLPCLACSEWVTRRSVVESDFAICHIRWKLSGDMMPFPWRSPDGQIFFPTEGEGYYYTPEYFAGLAALESGVVAGSIELISAHVLDLKCSHKPFSWVRELYEIRREWKQQGIGAEKVLKLGLNSLYGKTAQRVGGRDKAPTWHQLEWAGYITSSTRARIYRASFPAIKSNALVFFATDAIVSLIPLPDLDTTDILGNWEPHEFGGLLAVQSGVYWLGPEFTKPKTRGFYKAEIDPHEIVRSWARGDTELKTQITRFIGMGRALVSDNSWGIWRTWDVQPKRLSLTPHATKRQLPPGQKLIGRNRVRPDKGLVRTVPAEVSYWQDKKPLSTPVALPWEIEPGAFDPSKLSGELRAEQDSEDAQT